VPRSKEEKGKRSWRDFELRGQLDTLSILDYATSGRVVGEALEMKDEHRWKRFNEYRDWTSFSGNHHKRGYVASSQLESGH